MRTTNFRSRSRADIRMSLLHCTNGTSATMKCFVSAEFENSARYLNFETNSVRDDDRRMSPLSFSGPRTREPPGKSEKRGKSSKLSRG